MSCAGCESLLCAQLRFVKDELQADTDQQLDELRKRVCKPYSYLHNFFTVYNTNKQCGSRVRPTRYAATRP